MRGLASGDLREDGAIWRDDGYGFTLLTVTKASVRHRLNQPAPDDPQEATAANAEFVEVHFPWDSPVRIGDKYVQDGRSWVIGLTNITDSYSTFARCYAARPIAATPRQWVSFRRYLQPEQQWIILAPQLVQLAWSKNQPDRLGGVAIRQYGYIFAPEDMPPLDVQQGDTFYLDGMSAVVTWAAPSTGSRREALFAINVGEGV